MPVCPSHEEIAALYGLESVPENVRRLTQMVSRQDGSLDELARIVETDQHLTSRLLRAANPRSESEEDYTFTTVEAALARMGMGCALILAMGELLRRAVLKTFHTMLSLELSSLSPAEMGPIEGEHLFGEVQFSGKAAGLVDLRLPLKTADLVAARMLANAPGEVRLAEIEDAVGELTNMVVGNFKSNLCDAGLECRLSTPQITRANESKLRCVLGGLADRMGFRDSQIRIFVDISVNPWGE